MSALRDIPESIDFRDSRIGSWLYGCRHIHESSLIHSHCRISSCKLSSHRTLVFLKEFCKHISSSTTVNDNDKPLLSCIVHTHAYSGKKVCLVCTVVIRSSLSAFHEDRISHHSIADFIHTSLLIILKILINLNESRMGNTNGHAVRSFLGKILNRSSLKDCSTNPLISNVHSRNKLIRKGSLRT